MKKIMLLVTILGFSTLTHAYDNNGCEAIDNLKYHCTEIISAEGQDRNIERAEICIGNGGIEDGLYATSENLSERTLNWQRRNVTDLVVNNSNEMKFVDSDKSITGCTFNPGSSCYRKEIVTLNKKDNTVKLELKFSTSKFFIGGWTNDVVLTMKCEEII